MRQKVDNLINTNYSIEIIANGKPLREYDHCGQVYICGKPGQEYTIRIRNFFSDTILAVVTVDGLSIMDGKPGSVAGGGYILDPWETIDIPGWRIDKDNVAKFMFGHPPDAYATKTGRPDNLGVIGIAVYRKEAHVYTRIHNPPPFYTPLLGQTQVNQQSVTTCCARSMEKAEKTCGGIGTSFGDKTQHGTTSITFNRQSEPSWRGCIYYDTRENLKKMGIIVERDNKKPDPFPADCQTGCKPPDDWVDD